MFTPQVIELFVAPPSFVHQQVLRFASKTVYSTLVSFVLNQILSEAGEVIESRGFMLSMKKVTLVEFEFPAVSLAYISQVLAP